MDEIARAYATLGVSPGKPLESVRKSYKALVRKWHPDRFAGDPQGQAEATIRMRAINDAFRTVVASRVSRVPESSFESGAATGPVYARREPGFGRRLTREEIDRMVEAMRNDGPLDWLEGTGFDGAEDRRRTGLAGVLAGGVGLAAFLFARVLNLSDGAVIWSMIVACVASYALLLRFLGKK